MHHSSNSNSFEVDSGQRVHSYFAVGIDVVKVAEQSGQDRQCVSPILY